MYLLDIYTSVPYFPLIIVFRRQDKGSDDDMEVSTYSSDPIFGTNVLNEWATVLC
jgi:hypothetical protein